MTTSLYATLVSSAAAALKERKEEVNRLNVFPVPDGDTGTNMSLTMDVVVAEVAALPADADTAAACHAITHGSLMGARGNSGVILSQILRGLCEGIDGAASADSELLATALERSVTVAFQAVRKPVEGTILTVLRDAATAARHAADQHLELSDALRQVSAASFDSVRRTPELLPVLKENGVVDAGGFGLAILIEGFVAAALGEKIAIADVSSLSAPILSVDPVDDWDDDEYLYCTEFLLFGEGIDSEAVHDYVAGVGGSELVVGSGGEFKVHVHTNDPGSVLAYMTGIGEVSDVHIHNMRRQSQDRDEGLAKEKSAAAPKELKPVGFVAVAAGEGLAEILGSLGVDLVVSGGQTMNPSTKDLADAIAQVPAKTVIVLPNNKNIIMAAQAAASVAQKPVGVVPTTSVPQAFSAMLGYDGVEEDPEAIVAEMTEAAQAVRTGEVTTAVKDAKGKAGAIKAGQVIGISDHEIEIVGDDVASVASGLATLLLSDGAETLTLLAGEDFDDDSLAALADAIEAANPGIDVEALRGEQPLYPVLMSAE
ncbi:MAG: DAK2 domain-containing protein [Coriobacteriia bacterium]|nr:DAK2 domain-containing protein [Coriobacteriia bacterium]